MRSEQSAAGAQAAPEVVRLTVDGASVSVPADSTLLDAAGRAGVHVPTLCFLAGVSAVASCRVCVVEVEGCEQLLPACATPAREGMAVRMDTPRVLEARRCALELVLSRMTADTADLADARTWLGSSELAQVCREVGVSLPLPTERATNAQVAEGVLDANPFLSYDPALCMGCQRCVGACANLAGNHTLRAGKAGVRTQIRAPFGPDWRASGCESCGCCAQACPTGAISLKRRRSYAPADVHPVRTTCPHCAVGCQLDLMVAGDKIVDVHAADGPSNRGMLCVKGRSASFDFVSSPDRLTTPLLRNKATGELEPVSWDDALDAVAEGFGRIIEQSGGEALAAFACSRSTNEDIYLFQKMVRVALHTNNVDNCARV